MTPYKEYGLSNLQLLLVYGAFTHTKTPAWAFFALKPPVLDIASSTSALTWRAASPTAKAPPGPTNLVLLCLSSPQHQPKEALPSILKRSSFTQSMGQKIALSPSHLNSKGRTFMPWNICTQLPLLWARRDLKVPLPPARIKVCGTPCI